MTDTTHDLNTRFAKLRARYHNLGFTHFDALESEHDFLQGIIAARLER